MIFRLFFFAALVWLALRAWSRYKATLRRPPAGRAGPPQAPYEAMTRCRDCGVYLPRSALSQDERCGRCLDHSH